MVLFLDYLWQTIMEIELDYVSDYSMNWCSYIVFIWNDFLANNNKNKLDNDQDYSMNWCICGYIKEK